MKVRNPFTGRLITYGGSTYMKAYKELVLEGYSKQQINKMFGITMQSGGSGARLRAAAAAASAKPSGTESKNMFTSLVDKATSMEGNGPAAGAGNPHLKLPESKYHLINSENPPAPEQSESWYHHHAPFSQNFGDYVCLKRSSLKDLGVFLKDALFTDVDGMPLSQFQKIK